MLHPVLSQLLGDDYVSIPAVPILDEHVLTTRDGDTEAVVDAAFLESVAANNNARLDRTGDATPVVIGHTREGEPETSQPPLVGYATAFRVGDFNATGRQALYCDFHVRRDREQVLRDFPRRSVELWVRKREIDPISLLGATTPERDLGILRYRRSDDTSLSIPYARCPPMADPKKPTKPLKYEAADAPPPTPEAAEKAESSDSRELSTKLDKILELLDPIAQVLGEAMQGGDEPADDKPADDKPGDDKPEDAADEPDSYEADPDDDLLGPADDGPEPERDAAEYRDDPVRFGETYLPKVAKMNRQSDEVVKLQRQNATMAKDLADVKLKYARLEAEKQVNDLEKDGVVFADRDEDVETLARLSTDAAKKHFVEKIKRNYAKDVTRVAADLTRYSRDADAGAVSMSDVQTAIDSGKFKTPADAIAHFAGKAGR